MDVSILRHGGPQSEQHVAGLLNTRYHGALVKHITGPIFTVMLCPKQWVDLCEREKNLWSFELTHCRNAWTEFIEKEPFLSEVKVEIWDDNWQTFMYNLKLLPQIRKIDVLWPYASRGACRSFIEKLNKKQHVVDITLHILEDAVCLNELASLVRENTHVRKFALRLKSASA
jgi:hypothetical protein